MRNSETVAATASRIRAAVFAALTFAGLLAAPSTAAADIQAQPLPPAAAQPSSPCNPYCDVPYGHVFGEEVRRLAQAGVLQPRDTPGGTFRVDEPARRGDLVRWMGALAQRYPRTNEQTLYRFAATAAANSLGGQALTRHDAAGLFVEFLSLGGTADSPGPFDDVDPAYVGDVSRLYAAGITTGCAVGRYCGEQKFTRGQAAAFMGRYIELHGPTQPDPEQQTTDLEDDTDSFQEEYTVPNDPPDDTDSTSGCPAGQHRHINDSRGGYCHDAHTVPGCSPQAGVWTPYSVHDSDKLGGHRMGRVPPCPPPDPDLDHPQAAFEVISGQTPVLVLSADEGALTTRRYQVTLAPYTQSPATQTWCASLSDAGKSGLCSHPARPGIDYANVYWPAVEIGPGESKSFSVVVPGYAEGLPARTDFGTLPRKIEYTVTDVDNPEVTYTGVVTINPPAIAR